MGTMTISRAHHLMRALHDGQLDRAGLPYWPHPDRVSRMVLERGGDRDQVLAGMLHDVLEDTHADAELLRRFGASGRTVWIVEALTRREGETYVQFIDRTLLMPPALLVKLCDVLDNLDPARQAALPYGEAEAMTAKRYAPALRRLVRALGGVSAELALPAYALELLAL